VIQNKACELERKCKDRAIPAEACTGPEGYGRLRFPDFKTIGTNKTVVKSTGRLYSTGNIPGIYSC